MRFGGSGFGFFLLVALGFGVYIRFAKYAHIPQP